MKIHYIFTACIRDEGDFYEELYAGCIRDTLSKLSGISATFYVVENNGQRVTALDTIENIHVVYTDSNARPWGNATKEIFDIKCVAEKYGFADEDIVVKHTGRYTIEQPTFLEELIEYEETSDVFMKFYNICTRRFDRNDCIMGLFGIRYRVLKAIDIGIFEGKEQSCEIILAKQIRDTVPSDRIAELRFLDMYFRGSTLAHI